MAPKARRTRKARQKLSAEEQKRRREDRRFKSDIRTVFTNAGFTQVRTRDVRIAVAGMAGDLDAMFVYENIVVAVEDTVASVKLGDHLRKKSEFFGHLARHHAATLEALRSQFDRFEAHCSASSYHPEEYQIRFVYASRHDVAQRHQQRYADNCIFLSIPVLQYFLSLTRAIKKSARFEIFKFLRISLEHVGSQVAYRQTDTFRALQLPEVPSGFPPGHRLVSFLIDPGMLLERAYVLRADSWRDREALYQRLLVRNKIRSMRRYLVEEGRVFVNNIIATLGSDSTYVASNSYSAAGRAATTMSVGTLTLPRRFDAIGIIDGQHRVYAYHEGDDALDRDIATLRGKQHLLVTGIIYPQGISRADAEAFEAKLFLEINDKQKRVKADLKQSIELLLSPCSDVAIAKAVLNRLGTTGALGGVLALHFFDTKKLKTASIVSYGLRHVVSLNAEPSFYRKWRDKEKSALRDGCDREVLERYVRYCSGHLDQFLSAFKAAQPEEMWTTDRKKSRVLTTTTINGLIFCMRLLLANDKLMDFKGYRYGFEKLTVSFGPHERGYRSSHWRRLGERIYTDCFASE